MIGEGGNLGVFWSNWLVGSITTLALVLLFWPLISLALERLHEAREGRDERDVVDDGR